MSGIYIFFTLEAQRSTGGIGGGIEDCPQSTSAKADVDCGEGEQVPCGGGGAGNKSSGD